MSTPTSYEYQLQIPCLGLVIEDILTICKPQLKFETVPTGNGGFRAINPHFSSFAYFHELSKHNKHGHVLVNQTEPFDIWVHTINSKTKEVVSEYILEYCNVLNITSHFTTDVDFVEVEISIVRLVEQKDFAEMRAQRARIDAEYKRIDYNRAMSVLEKKK